MKVRIVALEKKLRPLLKMFPDPLKEKLKPILARFPEDSDKSTASLAERLQNVLGLTDQANAFNSAITSVKELRTFPDGTRAEVTTVYLGLAQAYYTNSEGTLAGVGHPGPDGWVWKPENAQGKSSHHYSLREFGLSADWLRHQLGPMMKKHGFTISPRG